MTELKIENGKIKNIKKSQVLALKEQVSCQKGQVVSKTLVQNNAVSVTLFAFDKDEEISTHESEGDAFVTCLDGVAKLQLTVLNTFSKRVNQSLCLQSIRTLYTAESNSKCCLSWYFKFLQPIILRTFRTTQTALLTQPTFGICHLAIFNTNTHRENGFSCFSFNTSAVSTSIIVRCKEKTIEIQKEINRFFICIIIIFAIYQPIAALKIFSLFFINLSTACRPHFFAIHSIASE